MTTKELNKPFPITSVCRADLVGMGFKESDVEKINDAEMSWIASKIGDGIMTDFWLVLEERAKQVLANKK